MTNLSAVRSTCLVLRAGAAVTGRAGRTGQEHRLGGEGWVTTGPRTNGRVNLLLLCDDTTGLCTTDG